MSVLQVIVVEGFKSPHMRIDEAAEYLGISRRTLYKMVRERQIPYRKVRGTNLFHRDELDKWVARHRVAVVPERASA